LTSGTFTRVRLFTDVEDITLDKWLDAENSGQDELAKKILDAGLLVEHMIPEIPMDQNLADNSEQKTAHRQCENDLRPHRMLQLQQGFQQQGRAGKELPELRKQLSRKRKLKMPTPASRSSHPDDEVKNDWFDSTGQDAAGRHAVRSK